MIGLDRLMKTKGVVAAGQFSDDGKVVRKVGNFPPELADTAELCVKQNQCARDLMAFLDSKSDMEWQPMMGWAIWGGKYAMVVMGNTRVIVDTKYADFNQLMVDLFGSEATGGRPPLLSGL